MPQQVLSTTENNFTRGLITEATGLNFPENAATSASNCIFTLVGDVTRREGINYEANGSTQNIAVSSAAYSSYVWNNPGGDGNSKLYVKQVGATLYFYNIAKATVTAPLSTQFISGQNITVSNFTAANGTFDPTQECQYADGNGYLIVTHPSCDPFYITYDPVNIIFTSNLITINTRDEIGLVDPGLQNANANVRPATLSNNHFYNLQNQGWTTGNPWTGISLTSMVLSSTGSQTFVIQTGLSGPAAGQSVNIIFIGPGEGYVPGWGYLYPGTVCFGGTVTGYTSGTGALVVDIINFAINSPEAAGGWQIVPQTSGPMGTFFVDAGLYPSNSDVWWYFKDDTGGYNPSTTLGNVTLGIGNAPKGHFVLNEFNQNRNVYGVSGITNVATTARPTTTAWYAGRAWYTGVNGSFAATSNNNYYTWTENIYFSQVSVNDPSVLGNCYQNNDPTSETLFDILPTDGGSLTVYGSGSIHKLWPTQNGLLVFANNGVWFITGSQGIGFTADDYTITKISSVKVLSSKSFVDVLGLPYFWNEEGIYQVVTGQSGALAVEPLTVGTILTYYNNIPLASKKYAKGDYDPINYIIQWGYRSTQESGIANRYQFDTILTFNTYNKAFYPYNISNNPTQTFINDVKYVSYPYITTNSPDPNFKYSALTGIALGFAEEYDETYVDWGSVNYTSSFTTGYKLHGQGWRKFQAPYLLVYSRNNGYASYYVQSAWDYGIDFDSNRWSQPQFSEINDANSSMFVKRHKMRGRGRVLQLMFTSVPGQPFDIMGWSMYENANASV